MDSKLQLYTYDQGDLITPRGFLNDLKQVLTKHGLDPAKVITYSQVLGRPVDFGPWNSEYTLRPYQLPYVEAITTGDGVGVAPAGSGKTIMGCRAILEIGRPTLWLTHTTDLMYQTKTRAEATLKGVGIVGILGDAVQEWGSGKLIIATVQTLQANPQLISILDDLIGLIVVDEAHHFPAMQFIETVGKFSAARVIGLTATPDRKDCLEFYMYAGIGPLLYTIDRNNLYDGGSLLKPEVKFIFTAFAYEQASLREGTNVDAGGEDLDYHELLQAVIHDEARARLVASTILDYTARGTSLVLTESVRYLFYLRDFITQQARIKGVKIPRMAVVHGGLQRYTWQVAKSEKEAMAMIDAGTAEAHKYDDKARRWKVKVKAYTDAEFTAWQVTGKQRKDLIEAVRNKEYDILLATQLAREGLDIDHLTVEHMAMSKKGDAQDRKDGSSVEQELGRIQRPDRNNTGKAPILIDYVDYNVGVFQAQYYTRRKVYKRLGLTVPGKDKKPKDVERDLIDTLLGSLPF
jgi:superfamily II DNA or RNA helicase